MMNHDPKSLLRAHLPDLAHMQRQWAKMLPGGEADSGHLSETQAFGNNPGALRMLSFVPPGLGAGAPLVVVLHGCTQTAAGYDTGAGWSDLATRHGFALLLPEQTRSNNANGCFNWFEPGDTVRGEGEVASIRAMVARMVADHGLDARRVFVTGLSAGGAMTSALLATYPDVFAAGAVIAGLPFGAASGVQAALGAMKRCRSLTGEAWGDLVRSAGPGRASAAYPRVAIWHGDADQTVTPSNALESAKQWVNVHGLQDADGVEDRVDGVPHRMWRDRHGEIRVELYAVPRLGHGTPIDSNAGGDRGVGQPMPYILDASISSTWHIAQRWGLLRAGSAAGVARPSDKPALPDVTGVIARTLRAAGLLGST